MTKPSHFARVFLFVGVALALMPASSADAQSRTKKDKAPKEQAPPEPAVLQLPPGVQSKPIQADKIVIRIPSNKVIGAVQQGLFCAKVDDLRLKGGTFSVDDPAYTDRLRDEFTAAGYTLTGDPNALFKDRDSGKAEFLIGGMITDIKANICEYGGGALFDQSGGYGEMKVDWQIFSTLNRQVVYQAQTRGSTKVPMKKRGSDEVLIEAFGASVRQLLADRAVFDLLTAAGSGSVNAGVAASSQPQQVPGTVIARLPMTQRKFQDVATDIRGNVVTVFTGGGSGTGFFVSDRHIISNAHVVGAAKFVKIKFITGREILGEVLVTDAARDVALVQTEASGLPGLPIRIDEPGIGAGVFAVGSPLGEENEGTVSAGIISSYRSEDGQRFIQSDVNVMPGNSGGPLLDDKGNVIGLTVAGRVDPRTGGGTGLNFFIPITDAMAKLGLQFK